MLDKVVAMREYTVSVFDNLRSGKRKQSIPFFLCLQQIPNSYSADGCCSCGHVFTEKKLIGGKRFSGKCNMHLSPEGKVISMGIYI